MAKYEKHPEIEGKYRCPICDYGHKKGRSRQAVSAHYDKVHGEKAQNVQEDVQESRTTPEPIEAQETPLEGQETIPIEFTIDETPEWLRSGSVDESEDPITPSPMKAPVKGFLKSLQKEAKATPGKKRSQKEHQAYLKQQGRIARWAFVCVDRLVVWWGRGVLEDRSWDITRSQDEWNLIESATVEFMDHRGLSIPISPDLVFLGTITAAYAPPILHVQKNRKKPFGIRNPIKAWFLRRKIKKQQKEAERHAESI